jgi:GAF domain-containing protein
MIGSLNLGEKKSGKPYNREDIDLLRTLAHQGAVAIENARMVD